MKMSPRPGKAKNIYIDFVYNVWYLIKKASKAIVSALPSETVYSTKTRISKTYFRDEDLNKDPEKHYHQKISKPAVEKQTLIKESKKQKGYHP